ncbi:MAG: hypothetical protein ACYCW6_21705 [Candidatus Xenobia bacterium]
MKRLLLALLLVLLSVVPSQATGEGMGTPCAHMLAGPRGCVADYQAGLTELYSGHAAAAVKSFQAAVKLVPNCALLHTSLSKALLKAGQRDAAFAEQARADALMDDTGDREQRLCYAWSWHVRGLKAQGKQALQAFNRERGILDYAIVVYKDDADIWAARGDAAETPLRAAPYRIFLLKFDPGHPLAKVWKTPHTTCPSLKYDAQIVTVSGPPAKPQLFDNLGDQHITITTSNPLAQKYFDQGMRCFDAYVTPSNIKNSAAQCYQYALQLDPKCAMALWGVSFCISENDKANALQIAKSAYALSLQHGTDKERRFCAARVLELAGGQYREAFLDALDGAICAYPDEIELWVWRGKVYGDYGQGPEDETPSMKVLAGMSFELAAVAMRPDNPSPNHELIHDYEAINRPELAWPYTVGFRKDAPNMPHANHMQAHIAMRLGRWDDALDATEASYRKSKEGYPELDPSHHLYVRLLALAHEGHFQELIKTTPGAYDNICWARMLRLMANEKGLIDWTRQHLKAQPDNADYVYMAALVDLDLNDPKDAGALIDKLKPVVMKHQYNYYNYLEAYSRWLIETGKVDQGFALFRKTAARSVNDANLHFFGGGGYFPEVYGEEALRHHRLDEAEFAFSESLAHDHGSIVAALGMQVVEEARGNKELAASYAARAADMWKHADPGSLQRQLDRLRGFAKIGEQRKK